MDEEGGREREKEKERNRESPTNQVLYREKSSLLVRRKKLRLKILSWGRGTLSASARKGGGGGRLPQSKVEYEANATNEERLKHSHQFLSSPLITDVTSSSMLIPVKQCL